MIDQIVYQFMIYCTTTFGIRQELFFSPIAKVSTVGTENVMELFGYTYEQWFLMCAFMAVGAFWLGVMDHDDR